MNASPSIQLLYLDHQKTRCLSQTLQAILALEGTEETFGQIIDGLSTFANAVRIAMDPWRHGIEDRQHPTEVSVELFRAFRDKLQPHLLMVDAKVAQNYQNTTTGSHEFLLQLLELTAIIVHNLAVDIFQEYHTLNLEPPMASAKLYHPLYQNWTEYARGAPDIVGYWAETQIFGGVVAFDRGSSGRKNHAVYIHPPVGKLFRLSQLQLERFSTLGEVQQCRMSNGVELLLPFAPEPGAQTVGIAEALSRNIFRNEYDRRLPVGTTDCHGGASRRIEDYPDILKYMQKFRTEQSSAPGS